MINRKKPARHKVTRNGKTFWRGKGAAVRAAMPRLNSLTNGDSEKSKSMFLEEFFSNPSRKGQFNDIDEPITYDHLSGGSETPTPKQKATMLSAAKKDSAALKKQGIKHKIHNDQLGAHIKILNSNSSTVKPSKARVKSPKYDKQGSLYDKKLGLTVHPPEPTGWKYIKKISTWKRTASNLKSRKKK